MIDDYLKAEGLIIARLKATIPALRVVMGVADAAKIEEATQVTPNALVIYHGDAVPGTGDSRAGSGAGQFVVQRWMVTLCVRHAGDVRGGSGARAAAGPLLADVIEALSGWKPATEFRPLQRTNAPLPDYNKGFAYFPLMFEARLATQAT